MGKEGGDKLLYALVGCAAVAFFGLCGATGVGVYLVMRSGGMEAGAPAPFPATPAPGTPGGKPDDVPGGGPASPLPRLRVAATVTAARGGLPVTPGAPCLFDVQPPDATSTMCRTQVVCGGQLLYGGENAGYFPCAIGAGSPPSITGQDAATTAEDRDAAMTLDTGRRLLTVVDDARGPFGAFEVEARVDSVE